MILICSDLLIQNWDRHFVSTKSINHICRKTYSKLLSYKFSLRKSFCLIKLKKRIDLYFNFDFCIKYCTGIIIINDSVNFQILWQIYNQLKKNFLKLVTYKFPLRKTFRSIKLKKRIDLYFNFDFCIKYCIDIITINHMVNFQILS